MHTFEATVTWTGNTGSGTSSWSAYERSHLVRVAGKPDIPGSASPSFRGDAGRHNPEDLFIAAIAACHMLFFLSRCARAGIRVVGYEDRARGTLEMGAGGGGRFSDIVLRPVATLASADAAAAALPLHEEAHRLCFLAASCSAPIRIEPQFLLEESA